MGLYVGRNVYERGKTRDKSSYEVLSIHLRFRISGISYFSTLHENDWLMSVLAYRGGSKSINIVRPNLFQNKFETYGGDMMALVNDYHSIILNKGLYFIFLLTRLN